MPVDGAFPTAHHSAMADAAFTLKAAKPLVVGSFGNAADLAATPSPTLLRDACDVVEIRLDLLAATSTAAVERAMWAELAGVPLLFTARRADEGGSLALSDAKRQSLLQLALPDAACVDIEVASIDAMAGWVKELRDQGVPWVASFHDFKKFPAPATVATAVARARDAGAAAFKLAAMLHTPAELARLAEFQLADHGLPVATMGMGALAPVSRLLCAQCGSVLNYGYLGGQPTAPGQWDAAFLRRAIARLEPFQG